MTFRCIYEFITRILRHPLRKGKAYAGKNRHLGVNDEVKMLVVLIIFDMEFQYN